MGPSQTLLHGPVSRLRSLKSPLQGTSSQSLCHFLSPLFAKLPASLVLQIFSALMSVMEITYSLPLSMMCGARIGS